MQAPASTDPDGPGTRSVGSPFCAPSTTRVYPGRPSAADPAIFERGHTSLLRFALSLLKRLARVAAWMCGGATGCEKSDILSRGEMRTTRRCHVLEPGSAAAKNRRRKHITNQNKLLSHENMDSCVPRTCGCPYLEPCEPGPLPGSLRR